MNVVLDVSSAAAAWSDDRRQAELLGRRRSGTDHRMDHGARGAGNRHRGQTPHAQGDHHPHRQRQGRRRQWMGGTWTSDRGIMLTGGTLNLHGDRPTPGPNWPARRSRQHLDPGAELPTGRSATRSSSPRRISIHGRPSGAPLLPSAATRSRWTRSSTTCTSARSPSTWMNAAKSAC